MRKLWVLVLVLFACVLATASYGAASPKKGTGDMICGTCGDGGGPPPGGCDPTWSPTYNDGHGTVWYCTSGHYWAVLYNY